MDTVQQACDLLQRGEVVVFPTESVYGLAADSTNDLAIASIYSIKGRPTFNPLIAHVSGLAKARRIGVFNDVAVKLAEAFWAPGTSHHRPLTIIVKMNSDAGISALSVAGLSTIGIRVPNHEITNALLDVYPNPLSAPSANITQQISATNAGIIRETLGNKVPLIIDGGQCCVGLESTIIDLSAPEGDAAILRYGGTSAEEIGEVIGYMPKHTAITDVIKAPGMAKRHYATRLPLKINQIEPRAGAAYLGFCEYDYGEYNLSKCGDLNEAAANLFKMLFELDNPLKYSEIRVAPVPARGIGLAINDRLERASALA
ncbi:MAG: threonylcarbamoyl-AMP synthase [Holosporales bacterium]|jgi:L-threonylcarbamoyladenylate synthase|nr:threonylcarbamoyl-AMP synthase [Holosporales bacterium]